MAAVTCKVNNLNGLNQFLSLEHSLLLFDYDSSAMKIPFYSSRQRLNVEQNPGLSFKKWKLRGAPTQSGVINLLSRGC